MTTDVSAPELVAVTVVESPGCHYCADAHAALDALGAEFPITVTTLDIRSDTGERLVREHRAALTPLVLLDGQFFSHGRLPRRKLARLLGQRFGTPTPTRGA